MVARGSNVLNLSVPDMHQLKVARDTLRMSDAGALIMGGPDKRASRRIILRLTGRFSGCLECGGPMVKMRPDNLCSACTRRCGCGVRIGPSSTMCGECSRKITAKING